MCLAHQVQGGGGAVALPVPPPLATALGISSAKTACSPFYSDRLPLYFIDDLRFYTHYLVVPIYQEDLPLKFTLKNVWE